MTPDDLLADIKSVLDGLDKARLQDRRAFVELGLALRCRLPTGGPPDAGPGLLALWQAFSPPRYRDECPTLWAEFAQRSVAPSFWDQITKWASEDAPSAAPKRKTKKADIGNLDSDRLISAKSVAGLLGIAERSVWRYVSAGHLPKPVGIGTRTKRWSLRAVQRIVSGESECA